MKIMLSIWKILWKSIAVVIALIIGAISANQAGWSTAELIVNSSLMSTTEEFITGLFANLGLLIAAGSAFLVQKLAKPLLWLMVPVLLYCAVVPGAWNGFVSDFDWTRGQAIKYQLANAYALERMSQRARYLSCHDEKIELTDDAKTVCART